MRTALIVVDVQNDFCEGGALAVVGGAQVAADITTLMDTEYNVIIGTKDTHDAPPNDNCGHFALTGEPDYINSWPVHCVDLTPGAEFHYNLQPAWFDFVVEKGYGLQSYSAFEGATNAGQGLLGLLRSYEIENVDIVGLAYDYCVLRTALDASNLGFNTRVLKSYTASVHPENDYTTTLALTNYGVSVVT